MAFEVSVKADLDRARAMLANAQREQLPFATASALTRTAYQGKETAAPNSMRLEMAAPQRFTLTGVRYQRATKQNLRASIFIDKSRIYLIHPAKGKDRTPYSFPWVMVPVGLARLQAGGKVGRVLSTSLARSYRSRLLADGKHFEGRIRGTMGIWERMDAATGKAKKSGRGLKLRVLYLPRTHYRTTWHFYDAMLKHTRLTFRANFDNALAYALKTARPSEAAGTPA
jgi:hypothetical protein